MLINKSGQALIEFILASVITLIISAFFLKSLKFQWDKTVCSALVFECVRNEISGKRTKRCRSRVNMTFLGSKVVGKAQCGQWIESVSMPYLEFSSWEF